MATQFIIDLGITDAETYSISNKSVKFDSELDIKPYLDEMAKYDVLKKVDFSGNTIGIEASKLLGELLLKFKDTIVEINFADFYTGRLKNEIPKSLEYLFSSLLQMPKLRVLNLSDNAFGLNVIQPVENFLEKAVSLEHLILSNNGMGPFAGERIGKLLYKMAQNKLADKDAPDSLKTFYCGRNRLENGSINYLAIGLRNHKKLELVRLYQNGIRPEGISKLILQGLKFNTALKVLDLQDNTFTLKGSELLLNSLGNWPDLEEINVNDCLLKPKGSLLLAESLSELKSLDSLKLLKLQYNELESDSLKLLAGSLEKLTGLKNIELNGNRFTEDEEEVATIQELLESRGGELDELDDLEEPDSDEEEEGESDEEESTEEEVNLDDLEKELAGTLSAPDASVDELTAGLKEATI